MRKVLMFVIVALIMAFAVNADAVPITFSHESTASGSLDGSNFSDVNFEIIAVGDTDNRQSFGGGFFIVHDSASINIDGVGTFDFITGTRTFVNNTFITVGFSRFGASGFDLVNGPRDAAFATWDMLSSIGPISGNGIISTWLSSPVLTDGGVLVLSDSGPQVTFEAVVGVPEPSTLFLLGFGLAGVGILRRRFKN